LNTSCSCLLQEEQDYQCNGTSEQYHYGMFC
jgi:hypothetical protein